MDWKNVLRTLAPTVATALGTPLAGGIVVALGELFGIAEPTQDKIRAVIENGQLTGEQISAIKQLELKLKAEEQERGFRFTELEVRDREGARGRDVELVKAGKRNWRADGMFLLAVGMIIGLVYAVWTTPGLNEYVKGIVTFLLGRFAGYLDNIYNFEFGTTRSSQDKNLTIDRLATK